MSAHQKRASGSLGLMLMIGAKNVALSTLFLVRRNRVFLNLT